MFKQHIRAIPREILFAIIVTIILGAIPYAVSAGELGGDPPDTVPYGETGSLPSYELTVVNVDMNAEDLLHAFDPTMPHITDTAYVMVQVEARNTGESSGTPDDAMWFSLHMDDDHVYDLDTHACDTWPRPPDSVTLAPGESARFNLCFVAPLWLVPDAGDAELVVHTNLITDQWPVTFSLDKPEPNCACLPPTPPPPCSCVPPRTQHDGSFSLQTA